MHLFNTALRRTAQSRDIALTFDDGPNPSVTPQILDLLESYSVQATFFLIGRFVNQCPDLVRGIAAGGHTLGNHSYTHTPLTFLSSRRIEEELTRCQDAISRSAGQQPLWMRPPFGSCGPQVCKVVLHLGFRGIAMWSFMCGDWKPQPDRILIARLATVGKGGDGSGDIVLLHDGDYRTLNGDRLHVVAALRYWLPRWRDAGHQFVTIADMKNGNQPS
jgi:peptidoglycan/xylan/chitin deacetylase (PgdA/CDA1 family)